MEEYYSKSAIENFTQTIASYGITVNAIGPTPVETDLIKAVPKNKIQDFFISEKSDLFRWSWFHEKIAIVFKNQNN